MRRVIIQIYCLYFSIFYFIGGVLTLYYGYSISLLLLTSGILNMIVAIKIMMYKTRTNMFYNTLFLYVSLIVNTYLLQKFMSLTENMSIQFVFLTLPPLLKDVFLLINSIIVFLSLNEVLDSAPSA